MRSGGAGSRNRPCTPGRTPTRSLRLVEQTAPKDDPDRKALACYGLLVSCPAAPETLPEQVWLRFVEDRPISAVTTQYLAWCCDKLAKLGKKALLMIWDNASWHLSKEVRDWLAQTQSRRSDSKAREYASSLATCPARVLGSTASSRTGCMASARSSSLLACSRRRNWPTGSVPTLAAIMSHILPSPKRRPDSALERAALVWAIYHNFEPVQGEVAAETSLSAPRPECPRP